MLREGREKKMKMKMCGQHHDVTHARHAGSMEEEGSGEVWRGSAGEKNFTPLCEIGTSHKHTPVHSSLPPGNPHTSDLADSGTLTQGWMGSLAVQRAL